MLNDQNIVEALNTVLRGVQVAQKRGAFTLEESATLYSAIRVVVPEEEANSEHTGELTQETDEETAENKENDE